MTVAVLAVELAARLRLNASGAPPSILRKILASVSAEEALAASAGDWAVSAGLSLEEAGRLRRRAAAFDALGEMARADALGVKILTDGDAEYPDILRAIPEAPLILQIRGRLGPALGAVALVGSRRPTPYGLRMARLLASEASREGGIVVSGLARGIDAAAHRAALAAGGLTWAVLGSGLGRVYPPEHESLAEEIVEKGGCVLSEFMTQEPPWQGNFPRRNRIVAGLSWATVVVEGEARSGSLITARLAAEQGREVFAVPGPADSPLSEAPHILMENGARPVRSLRAVFDSFPPGARPRAKGFPDGGEDTGPTSGRASAMRHEESPLAQGNAAAAAMMPPGIRLAEEHQKILELLGPDALTMEELASRAGWPVRKACGLLLEMEFKELIRPVAGQRYAKK